MTKKKNNPYATSKTGDGLQSWLNLRSRGGRHRDKRAYNDKYACRTKGKNRTDDTY